MKTITFDMNKYTDSLLNFVSGTSGLDRAIDPPASSFRTEEQEQRIIDETKRLLANPIEINDACIEEVLELYRIHHNHDLLEFGESVHRYFTVLAKAQATELVDYK
ncbi:MAG: hypothetical protein COA94_04940 [Rickettsiales bacterium]|nr:MAG: hypothetical protein COA94_04940 [Rickettsiales bacterium]